MGSDLDFNRMYAILRGREKKEDILGRRITVHTPPEALEKQRIYFASLTPTLENPSNKVDERTILPTGEIRRQHWEDMVIFEKTGKMIEMRSTGSETKHGKNSIRPLKN